MVHFILAHWRRVSTGMALITALGLGGQQLYEYLRGDCCAAGASCCHPGAACCNGHHAVR